MIATYNRAEVLRFAIESVLWQTERDWELWVVGDACTDETEQVVAAFGDERIRFVNLDRNVGEQSGPNREGSRRARGRFVAYLGHDDFWLPDHLERCAGMLDETGAGFVFALADEIRPDGGRTLIGATPTGRFEPWLRTVPSTWVVRREVVEQVGSWRPALSLHNAPQEDFVTRIHKAGVDMRLMPEVTVVKLTAGDRPGSYVTKDTSEHELFFRRIRGEPGFRERELTLLALDHAGREYRPDPFLTHLLRGAKDLTKRATARAGVSPYAFYHLVRYHRKGGFLDRARRRRGLGPLDRG